MNAQAIWNAILALIMTIAATALMTVTRNIADVPGIQKDVARNERRIDTVEDRVQTLEVFRGTVEGRNSSRSDHKADK